MKRKNIFKTIVGGLMFAMLAPLSPLILTSCSDEPDSEYFYTFTGEMMSEYLKNRPEYSEFAEIVERAGLMDQLSAYGHYTCFAPNNEAVDQFLTVTPLLVPIWFPICTLPMIWSDIKCQR